MVPCEKSNTVPFASSIMKSIPVSPAHSRFTIKLIWCTAVGSASSACCFLKYIVIIFKSLVSHSVECNMGNIFHVSHFLQLNGKI